MDNVTAAKKLIGLMDLTALNSDDNSGRIEKLCGKAFTPYGNVAAVCIWPRFVPLAKNSCSKAVSKPPRSSTFRRAAPILPNWPKN